MGDPRTALETIMTAAVHVISKTSSFLEIWDLVEAARNAQESLRYGELLHLFECTTNSGLRASIIDLIGQRSEEGNCVHLKSLLSRRLAPLVRYYCVRNMIEIGCDGWRPKRRSQLDSNSYKSLLAYEAYLKRRISAEELRQIAITHHRRPGDHWEWLTHPIPIIKVTGDSPNAEIDCSGSD